MGDITNRRLIDAGALDGPEVWRVEPDEEGTDGEGRCDVAGCPDLAEIEIDAEGSGHGEAICLCIRHARNLMDGIGQALRDGSSED